jgi:hypothetical protein
LHPGADQRDQLADEEEPEVAMPERAERGQPSAPAALRGDVAARLVGFRGFYFRNCVDDLFSESWNRFTLTELISSIE